MSSYRIKINPNDPSSFPEGRVHYARLDATTEGDIRGQEAQDNDAWNAHIGSSLDTLLREEGILDAVNETAQACVEAWQSSVSDEANRSQKKPV